MACYIPNVFLKALGQLIVDLRALVPGSPSLTLEALKNKDAEIQWHQFELDEAPENLDLNEVIKLHNVLTLTREILIFFERSKLNYNFKKTPRQHLAEFFLRPFSTFQLALKGKNLKERIYGLDPDEEWVINDKGSESRQALNYFGTFMRDILNGEITQDLQPENSDKANMIEGLFQSGSNEKSMGRGRAALDSMYITSATRLDRLANEHTDAHLFTAGLIHLCKKIKAGSTDQKEACILRIRNYIKQLQLTEESNAQYDIFLEEHYNEVTKSKTYTYITREELYTLAKDTLAILENDNDAEFFDAEEPENSDSETEFFDAEEEHFHDCPEEPASSIPSTLIQSNNEEETTSTHAEPSSPVSSTSQKTHWLSTLLTSIRSFFSSVMHLFFPHKEKPNTRTSTPTPQRETNTVSDFDSISIGVFGTIKEDDEGYQTDEERSEEHSDTSNNPDTQIDFDTLPDVADNLFSFFYPEPKPTDATHTPTPTLKI